MDDSGSSAAQEHRLDHASCGFLVVLCVAEVIGIWWVFSPSYPFQNCCNQNGAMAGFYVVAFGGLGLLFTAAALRGVHTTRQLRRKGTIAYGHISARRMDKGNLRRRTRYYITYQYDYEGTRYTREEQVSQQQYEGAREGGPLPVNLLPEVPRIARGVGIDPGVEHVAGCAIISFAIVALAVLAIITSLPHPP